MSKYIHIIHNIIVPNFLIIDVSDVTRQYTTGAMVFYHNNFQRGMRLFFTIYRWYIYK